MKKIYILLLLQLNIFLFAQEDPSKRIIPPSPSSQEFMKFGEVPVSHSSGVPDITIPLYTIKQDGIEIPIILKYHIRNVKPRTDISPIATGWTLDIGGQISRSIYGTADELSEVPSKRYKEEDISMDRQEDYLYLKKVNEGHIDTQYDIYNILALNKNGNFIVKKNNDTSFSPFFLSHEPYQLEILTSNQIFGVQNNHRKYIHQLHLTDENGYLYSFGGDNAIESVGRMDMAIAVSTWLLNKITDPNTKKAIKYIYNSPKRIVTSEPNTHVAIINEPYRRTAGPFLCSFYGYDDQYNRKTGFDSRIDFSTNEVYTPQSQNYMSYYVPLIKQIVFDSGTIVFDVDVNGHSIKGLKVYDKQNKIIKEIFFVTEKPKHSFRLLQKIVINDKNNPLTYTFDYHPLNIYTGYPLGTDIWGFYNGEMGNVRRKVSYSYTNDACNDGSYFLSNTKIIGSNSGNPSLHHTLMGSLKSITYPSGGKTIFEYDLNTYLATVHREQRNGGGLRISKIINIDSNEEIINQKQYSYEAGFIEYDIDNDVFFRDVKLKTYTGADRSGIFAFPTGWSSYKSTFFRNQPIGGLGSGEVKYNKVTETQIDNNYNEKGKTIFYYEYPFINEYRVPNSNSFEDNAHTFVRRDWSGALLKTIETFEKVNSSYVLRKRENNKYDNNKSNNYYNNLLVYRPTDMICVGCAQPPFDEWIYWKEIINTLEYDFRLFSYRNQYIQPTYSVLKNKTITEYMDGLEISYTTDYSYNGNKSIISQQITYPDKTIQTINYQYAKEKGNQYLIDKNMVGIPLETTTSKEGKMISKIETKYPISQQDANTKTNGLPLPISVISNDLNSNQSITNITYTKYDDRGNLLEYKIDNILPVAIVYGYNQSLPIAKIEGATYAQIQSIASDIIQKSNIGTEQELLESLSRFRTDNRLNNFQITTYTHKPLIGVSSITPPTGITEFYRYDSANRLEKVIDANNKVIKTYKYHYKN